MKSVLLIGLGNVAVGYDAADASSAKVLSHARAFSRHPAFRLAGGVDPDAGCRRRFETGYGVPSYTDIDTAMRELSPDVVVVATPTALHLQTVTAVLAAGRPQAMLCEKPLAYDLAEARQIVAACARQNCALFVNFFRQAEPGVAEIRARLADGRIGRPLKGVVWYSKGMFNSGVHFLSLLQNLLGEVREVRLIDAGRLWHGTDPEPDVNIAFAAGRVVFLAAREEDFFHNAVELIAPNGRLRYEAGGARIVWQGVEEDARFKGYTRLCEAGETIAADFDRIQWYVADQLAAAIEGRAAQLCSGTEALRTQEVLAIIKEKS
ncbi:MAG: Gfo/Idh/MocA family oxidoreductase [Sulfuritalea sp.]|nr:Gfo/Idh/MocA family oxidoreductase [Sulfuritalea sp.]